MWLGKKLDGSKLDGADDDSRRWAAAVVTGTWVLQWFQPLGLLIPDKGDDEEDDGTANGVAVDENDDDNIGGGVGVKLWESLLCIENEDWGSPDENIEDGW